MNYGDKNIMKAQLLMSGVLWIMFMFLLSSISYSQMGELQFEKISIESGLSQSSVLCIYQDHKNFLWFGTYEGLNRYDGYSFKVYKADPENPYSISNNAIECIHEDHLGMLWIGTGEGLSWFDRSQERFISYKNDPNDPNSLSNNYVRYIYEDRSGVLWIGTHGGGLNQFDREKEEFIRYTHDSDNPKSLSHNNVLSILEDSEGKLWVGTDGGLNYFDRQKGEFVHHRNDPKNPNSISHDGIWRIYEDRAGNLWIGTWGGGLDLYDRRENRFIRYLNDSKDPHSISHNIVRSICEDKDGNLWIGTDGGGLNIFKSDFKKKGSGKFIHYQNNRTNPTGLSSNSILSIFQDQSGIIWLGTDFGGINKYNPGKRKFAHYRNDPDNLNSLNNNSIFSVYEDSRGIIWIGTNGGGVNRFDRKKNQFIHYVHDPVDPNSLSNNVIRSICEDPFGKLWIGTDDGLNRFDPVLNKFIRYLPDEDDPNSISYNTVWRLIRDKSGIIWVSTMQGLNHFEYEKEEFIRYMHDENEPGSISGNFTWTIYEDYSGILWIGTNANGLNRFDPEGKNFVHYKYNPQDPSTISDNKILSIHGNQKGDLWFGTTNGLNKWDRDTKTFIRYSEKNGLPNNSIQGMLEDDHGNLWISTNNGLSKFNTRTKQFKNFFKSDGLQSNEFGVNACCKLKSGEMIFGGINGFNIFHPDSIKDNLDIPLVVLTGFKIFNKPVMVGEQINGRTILEESISECEELTLSYKDNVFSFEFSALHYASPEDNLYAYIMEGFDKEWNYTNADRRFVTYTNLPGGNYTFRVKASNDDEVWNEEGTSIKIIVTPPFWQTWWFRVLMIMFVITLIYTIYKIRVRNMEAHRRELEIKVEERTHQLSEKAHALEVAKKETDNILENVKEGFFLLDEEYKISSQYSSALESIFCSKKLANLNLIDFFSDKIPDSEIENSKIYFELLLKDTIDEHLIQDLNPLVDIEFTFDTKGSKITKYLNFNFKRIKSKKDKKSELIVTVRDVTKQVLLSIQLKNEEARREKLLQLMLSILDVEPKMLNDFSESTNRELEFVDRIMNHSEINDYKDMLVKVHRAIHLVKGNAKLLNIEYFAEQTHRFEDMISEIQNRPQISNRDINPLREKLEEIQTGMEEMEKIIEKMGQVLSHKDGKKKSDARLLLQSLENLISSFSSDLGKKIKFNYKNFRSNIIPERYHLLVKEVLIQLIRNSISHGIERPEDRKRLKKPRYGNIEISTFKRNGTIGFRLRDDGRGLQIEELKQRAIRSGKWKVEEIDKWNEQQIADLIFTSGITTSDKVDMVAGRGVGMDSVKHRLKEHNGEIRVRFDRDKYCEFEVFLPSAS